MRSRNAIPIDQEGGHKPKVKQKLKMVGAFYYNIVFREGLSLFIIDYHLYTLAKTFLGTFDICQQRVIMISCCIFAVIYI